MGVNPSQAKTSFLKAEGGYEYEKEKDQSEDEPE